MEEIIQRYVAGATRVIFVDIHTGLGPFGNAEVISNEPKESPGYRRATELWGDMVRTTHIQESVSVHISGSMKLALPRLLPGAEVTAVSLEFGTYPGPDVFWALREENWLQHHGGEEHPDRRRIKKSGYRRGRHGTRATTAKSLGLTVSSLQLPLRIRAKVAPHTRRIIISAVQTE